MFHILLELVLVPVYDEPLDGVEVAAAREPAGRLERQHAPVLRRLVGDLHGALLVIIKDIRV